MSDITNPSQKSSIITKITKIFFWKGNKNWSLDLALSYIFIGLIFLLPIFFWPSLSVPGGLLKALLVIIPTLLVFVLWIMSCLRSGTIVFPKTWLLGSALGLILVYLISTLSSSSVKSSLIGQGYEIGTFAVIALLFVLLALIPIVLNDRKKITMAQVAVVSSAVIIALFHTIRFIFGFDHVSLNVFTEATSNTIGKWTDLGIFFGLTSLLSLVVLENFTFIKKTYKYLSIFVLVVSLFFVASANLLSIWYVLGVFSIISLVYSFSIGYFSSRDSDDTNRSLPYTSLVVLAVSLIFILSSGQLGNFLSSKLGVSQVDVKPTWQATYDISMEVLKKDPVLGVGPNLFGNQWLLYKPASVNNTDYWNTDFDYGVGLIPTMLATTGILGFLGWLIFLSLFVYFGFRMIFMGVVDRTGRYLLLSSFFGAIYLWIMTIIYTPSFVNFALTFIFTGLTISVGIVEGLIRKEKFVFANNPKKSFISVLILIILILASISVGYIYVQKYLAAKNFQDAMLIQSSGNVDKIRDYVYKAASLDANDLYYRSLAEVYISQLSSFANQLSQANRKPTADESQRVQNILQAAFGVANEAVKVGDKDYENYLTLGRVYEFSLSAGLEGSYEGALNAYKKAAELNPKSPLIYLTMARLEVTNKDFTKARENINTALQLKNDYTDAAYLLSQIEVSQGNIKEAIATLEATTVFSPNQPIIFFQLGLLKYNQKDYSGAVVALERAVNLNNYYSNALYFLGLSYYKLGRTQEAIRAFEVIKALNPGNTDVQSVLNNMNKGWDPLATSAPAPTEPPVKQKTVKTTKDR
jgi:tetratricopeptide (TPR) repeat protein